MDVAQELSLIVPILVGEFDVGLLSQIEAHSVLGDPFKQLYTQGNATERLDELAADHYHVFGLEVFPYGSVFFNDNAHMGGPFPSEIDAIFQAKGKEAPSESDHLGQELSLLASLVTMNDAEAAGDLLYRLILSWYFPFVETVKRLEHPFFNALFDHLTSLLLGLAAQFPPVDPEVPAPELKALAVLDDEETGLKNIAEFLLAPRLSGVYLSRTELKEIGDRVEMPTGFGTRSTLLPQLFFTAVDYEKMPLLVGELEAICQAFLIQYQQWEKTQPLGLRYWVQQVEQSLLMLHKMKQSV